MIGAIMGDIVGSVYEFDNIKTKEFELFGEKCFFTDDSVMTVAVAATLMEFENVDDNNAEKFKACLVNTMHEIGTEYPNCGYGGHFLAWIMEGKTKPYNSYGNGSAMRVSPVGWYSKSLEETEKIAKLTAEITHNHPEGIKGAVVTAGAVYLARGGADMETIRKYVLGYYDINFTVKSLQEKYEYDVTCQGTVPQAMQAFFESVDFEDAIRNAISVGGDSDTLAAITGAVAEAYYGIDDEIKKEVLSRLDKRLFGITKRFEKKYVYKRR